ncbi:unnamed protein product [Rotaria magnacalcarata]|uniref:Uncharacterized protein n=1 Tax=Rotaria magnacalcarata TaxID=392030 RepID=A0A819TAP1_9BILA|nr:unnamed protein product [Rotaria magnacalcarata]CAF4084940.1 unnamed protein product [Rotaria magnacalcarata]
MTILFANIHGQCLVLNHNTENKSINHCALHEFVHQGYARCLRCYMNEPMISLKNITTAENCSSLSDLHCMDLYFHDTHSYRNLSLENIHVINNLFDKEIENNLAKQNSLNIHIKYDTLEVFSLATFRSLDNIKNRRFHGIQFELNNRDSQSKLKINDDLQNMTLYALQITMNCDAHGLYQYNYVRGTKHPSPLGFIKCEIQTTVSKMTSSIITKIAYKTSSTIILSTESTENIQNKFIVLSLVGSGSFVFCCILAGCSYLLFKQHNQKNDTHFQRRANIHHYYTECLQCTIQTLIQNEQIKFEETNQCLTIELQCIQLMFDNEKIFEDFFQFHQHFIYDLFNKDNGTNQNTLHVTIKENTIEEIDCEYIENIFLLKYQAYRALFFELHIQNQTIKINPNLLNITRFSIKIILMCGNKTKPIQTIYIIHNHKITLESEQESCSSIFIPSTMSVTSTIISESSSNEVLSILHEKSKHIIRIITLLISCLLCILLSLIFYCFKRRKHRYSTSSTMTISSNAPSTSHDISAETPLSVNDTPKLNSKLERSFSRMRALQLLEDDI